MDVVSCLVVVFDGCCFCVIVGFGLLLASGLVADWFGVVNLVLLVFGFVDLLVLGFGFAGFGFWFLWSWWCRLGTPFWMVQCNMGL